jgi:hypothetical protein
MKIWVSVPLKPRAAVGLNPQRALDCVRFEVDTAVTIQSVIFLGVTLFISVSFINFSEACIVFVLRVGVTYTLKMVAVGFPETCVAAYYYCQLQQILRPVSFFPQSKFLCTFTVSMINSVTQTV